MLSQTTQRTTVIRKWIVIGRKEEEDSEGNCQSWVADKRVNQGWLMMSLWLIALMERLFLFFFVTKISVNKVLERPGSAETRPSSTLKDVNVMWTSCPLTTCICSDSEFRLNLFIRFRVSHVNAPLTCSSAHDLSSDGSCHGRIVPLLRRFFFFVGLITFLCCVNTAHRHCGSYSC